MKLFDNFKIYFKLETKNIFCNISLFSEPLGFFHRKKTLTFMFQGWIGTDVYVVSIATPAPVIQHRLVLLSFLPRFQR